MSNRARLGLTAAAVLLAVVAFLALKPDEASKKADDPSPTVGEDRSPTATARSAPQPPEEVVLRDGAPSGGAVRVEATTGDPIRIVVRSDTNDEIHLHGYDIRRRVGPGRPARFSFTADLEGEFEIESHNAEDAGREPFGRLVVKP